MNQNEQMILMNKLIIFSEWKQTNIQKFNSVPHKIESPMNLEQIEGDYMMTEFLFSGELSL